MNKVMIYVYRGIVECEDAPNGVIVELHDYDIREVEENNPDRKYGHDLLGDYEVSQLHTPDGTPARPQRSRGPDKVKPLAQYLSEYIDYDGMKEMCVYMATGDVEDLLEVITYALDAYESTENVTIKIERK